MVAKIIDGKAFAEGMRAKIAAEVAELKQKTGKAPGLAVIQVGDDPASSVYVRNKDLAVKQAGMASFSKKLPANTTETELLGTINILNHDDSVHGILVQLPLPAHINKDVIIEAVAPEKDVDGFHPVNVARLEKGEEGFVPCTPIGCLMLIKDNISELAGKHAVVMGRSAIVGKPMAELLRKEGCKVEVIHSKTTPEDRTKWLKQADIVVVAVGKPKILSGKEIKQGAIVIDVGINRVSQMIEGIIMPDLTRLVGDVDYSSCLEVAGAITPVPGGVGPMTIACLLSNTLQAFKNR